MSKNDNKNLFKSLSSVADMGKKFAKDMNNNSEVAKLKSRQDDHKYNIGKIILEKKIEINDNLINSNIKTINDIMSE